jgi:hypothetical protein
MLGDYDTKSLVDLGLSGYGGYYVSTSLGYPWWVGLAVAYGLTMVVPTATSTVMGSVGGMSM